jgi:hypothetical protein
MDTKQRLVELAEEVAQKYKDPLLTGSFHPFFGKYKEKTFKDIGADQKYAEFVLNKMEPRTKTLILLHRYLNAIRTKEDGKFHPEKGEEAMKVWKEKNSYEPTMNEWQIRKQQKEDRQMERGM